jgi:hypothetical protein
MAGELSGAPAGCRDARIKGDVRTREKSELDAVLQVEVDNGAMLELGANNAFGLKAEPIAVELERHLQVVNSQRDDSAFTVGFSLSRLLGRATKRCWQAANLLSHGPSPFFADADLDLLKIQPILAERFAWA